jgi:ABC-2 type transport system permease protein
MTRTYWVWRRELAVMLRAPIVYLVGGLFLVVQGIAFAGLVGALSDPRRPAPLGALLEGQLAGTLLTWVLELVVLTLLGMRAIADDKRSGAWEALLTAGVGEGAAVTAKWLAAVIVYALVWLPTLAYLAVVALFRADDGGWDLPAIATGYSGAIALGAALLAWSIAASAATTSTLAAGALGFAWLIGLFLVGELPSLWPNLTTDHPSLALALDTLSLRTIATDFARGHLALRSLAVLAALTVVGLALAVTLACAGRRRARELRIRTWGTVALAAIGFCLCTLAARHPAGLDVSAARRNSLDPATLAVLSDLPGPATFTIVQPTLGALEPVYDEVARVAARMAAAAPALTVRRVDPASAPGGLTAIARAAGLQPGDLASGGAIVVELGGEPGTKPSVESGAKPSVEPGAKPSVEPGAKRRVVDLYAFATVDLGADPQTAIEQLAIEQALAGALAALSATRPITVCATRGHGELSLDPEPSGHDWSAVAQRLRGDGITVQPLDAVATGTIPPTCSAVLVAGPTAPLTSDEALALQRYVRGGGGLVVAAAGPLNGALPPTGLDGLLVVDGLGLPPAIAVDRSLGVREIPNALYVIDGYADHAINQGFARTRPTLWIQPRAVVATRGARPLVSATPASWGEVDLIDPPEKNPDDLAGPVALAALGSTHRIIAIGSADSLTSAVLAGGASAGDLWVARAIRFASGAPEPAVAVAARALQQVRLVMTPDQRLAVIALSVGGIPLAWAVMGGAVVWWRRRRAR